MPDRPGNLLQAIPIRTIDVLQPVEQQPTVPMAPSRTEQPIEIVWFKRDLRIADHRPLAEASARGPVLPLLVIEPEWWREPDMSARHYAFLGECAAELADALGALGQPLVVRVGDVVSVLDELAGRFRINGLWSHEETGGDWTFRRDLRVRDWCRSRGIAWREFRQDGVVRRLTSRDGWAKRWDRLMAEPITPEPAALAPLVTGEDQRLPRAAELGLGLDDPPLRQPGGRSAATRTLASFLRERGASYRSAMSSPISGEAACSRLSPYLAWGALSMREVAQATWARQRELKQDEDARAGPWRRSLVSFSGRLHWHCHFMQKLEDEPALERANLHPAYDGLRQPAQSDAARLAAWSRGETGLPFVDACMRYLAATGWLNFRMRAMLTAVASYHLWLHWRAPGLHLARQFTDYEPGIHWPQIQMQSGTTGINTVRVYNPIKQGHDQDPNGDFVRRWVPELAMLDGPEVHEPWHIGAGPADPRSDLPAADHRSPGGRARGPGTDLWCPERQRLSRHRQRHPGQARQPQERHPQDRTKISQDPAPEHQHGATPAAGPGFRPAAGQERDLGAMKSARGRTVAKSDLPEKICATCGRPFAWRKKWSATWPEVRYCSDRCRQDKKRRRLPVQ